MPCAKMDSDLDIIKQQREHKQQVARGIGDLLLRAMGMERETKLPDRRLVEVLRPKLQSARVGCNLGAALARRGASSSPAT